MAYSLPVLITVDVECTGLSVQARNPDLRAGERSLDCVVNGKPLGLPYILDTLDSHGLKGTFFVDPFSIGFFGEKTLDRVLDRILKSGHDVQLHLHPSWHWLKQGVSRFDSLHGYGLDEQSDLIGLGVRALQKRGVFPKAFRAGSFSANNTTYAALKRNGFTLSSSFNLSALREACRIEVDARPNDAFSTDGITEIPVTNYRIRDLRSAFGYADKPFQIGCTSFSTARNVLESARTKGFACVNMVLHNFEFVNRRNPDWLNLPMKALGNTITAFQSLCVHLSENRDEYPTQTFSEIDRAFESGKSTPQPAVDGHLPRINRLHIPLDLFNGSDSQGVDSEPLPSQTTAKPWYLGGWSRNPILMGFLSIFDHVELLLPRLVMGL